MFRIVLYALWSKDYLVSLAEVIAEAKGYGPLEITCTSSGKAYELCTNLLQFGGFVELFQIGAVSDAGIAEDFKLILDTDLRNWLVHVDGAGRALHMIESHTLGQLRFERDAVTHAIGLEMLARGATAIDDARMAEVDAAAEASRLERIAYAKEMTERYGQDWKHVRYLHRQYEAGYISEPPPGYPGKETPPA
jgi:hypothetical protein